MKSSISNLFLLIFPLLFSLKAVAQCHTQSASLADICSISLTECDRSNGKPTITGTFEIIGVKVGELKFRWQGKYDRYVAEVKHAYNGVRIQYYPDKGLVTWKRMWQDPKPPYNWHRGDSKHLFQF